MKQGIHPSYQQITVTCSCGNSFTTGSTLDEPLHIDVCSQCHPFYTGKQKIVDTEGRVERFKKRFAGRGKAADTSTDTDSSTGKSGKGKDSKKK